MGGQLALPHQGARSTNPLPGVTQGLALWARIFTIVIGTRCSVKRNIQIIIWIMMKSGIPHCFGVLKTLDRLIAASVLRHP